MTHGTQHPGVLGRLAGNPWLEPLQSVVITAAAAGVLAAGRGHLATIPAPFRLPWWVVALLSKLVALYLIRIEFRHDTTEFVLDQIVLVAGLFLASPAALMTGRTVGVVAATAVQTRARWRRGSFASGLAFEGACTIFESGVALVVFGILCPTGDSVGPGGLLAAFAAVVVSGLLRHLVVELALRTEGIRHQTRRALRHMLFGFCVSISTSGLALVALIVLWRDARVAWVLAVPTALVGLVYHVATKDRARQDSVQFLYEATRALQDTHSADDIAVQVLTRARDILMAESAQLLLLPSAPGRPGLRTQVGPGDTSVVMAPVDLDPGRTALGRLAASEEVALLDNPVTDPDLAAEGVREAMLAPLKVRAGAAGVILVANRVGNAGSFRPDELQVLQTLANHAGIALDNERLVSSLREAALHDALTGLANRTLLLERTGQALARARRTGRPFAVLLLDLDGFKTINDSLGHAVGDRLLVTVADRIKAVLRASDTAARLGGDEFAMLLEELDDPEAAAATGHRLIAALGEPVAVDAGEIVAAGSVGVAVWGGQGSADELLRDADAAMYAAKRLGKGTVVGFRPDMHQAALERLELETALRRAVRAGEITAEYQPVVALQTGRIVAVEALVRWRRPGHGQLVPPEAFLPLAEESGLVVPIGFAVLDLACRQLRRWRDELGQRAPVAIGVNLSLRQISQPDLVERVTAALAASGLAPGQLELDITQSTVLEEDEAMRGRLATLRQLGVRLTIDDFGTGYSSLSHLRRLPVDSVKIDGSFVAALADPDQDPALTRALVRLAQTLDLQVVAEGVETAEQLRLLIELRCPLGQGTYLVPPLPAEAMTRLLAGGPLEELAPAGRAGMAKSGPGWDAAPER